jgi:hypothetical protein
MTPASTTTPGHSTSVSRRKVNAASLGLCSVASAESAGHDGAAPEAGSIAPPWSGSSRPAGGLRAVHRACGEPAAARSLGRIPSSAGVSCYASRYPRVVGWSWVDTGHPRTAVPAGGVQCGWSAWCGGGRAATGPTAGRWSRGQPADRVGRGGLGSSSPAAGFPPTATGSSTRGPSSQAPLEAGEGARGQDMV